MAPAPPSTPSTARCTTRAPCAARVRLRVVRSPPRVPLIPLGASHAPRSSAKLHPVQSRLMGSGHVVHVGTHADDFI
eukprot:5709968-Prymnesium_polylepis.1